jgi:hypothetical protein
MLNIVIQQLLSQPQLLAAVFHTFGKLVVLKEEKNILLFNILVVFDDKGFYFFLELVGGLA